MLKILGICWATLFCSDWKVCVSPSPMTILISNRYRSYLAILKNCSHARLFIIQRLLDCSACDALQFSVCLFPVRSLPGLTTQFIESYKTVKAH